jgi:hypothetical protein
VNIFYNYSDMAMPLYDIIRKGVVVDKAWDQVTHGKSIQAIKDALTRGIGGILEQQNAEGKWQPSSILLLKLFEQRGKGLLSHRVGV